MGGDRYSAKSMMMMMRLNDSAASMSNLEAKTNQNVWVGKDQQFSFICFDSFSC